MGGYYLVLWGIKATTASRLLIWGFAAGFLAVLIFHQTALLGLHRAGIAPTPWSLAPVPPFGMPAVVSASSSPPTQTI